MAPPRKSNTLSHEIAPIHQFRQSEQRLSEAVIGVMTGDSRTVVVTRVMFNVSERRCSD